MDNYELYSEVCDYLQEAVNNDLMTEEEAMAIEAEAAERYGIVEESEELDEMFVVDSSFLEACVEDIFNAYEAEDTTDKASLKSFHDTMKELAGVYKNNLSTANKAIKTSNYKEAKKQIKDAKKALAQAKATTIAYKDTIPATIVTAICGLFKAKSIIMGLAAVIAGGSLIVGGRHTAKAIGADGGMYGDEWKDRVNIKGGRTKVQKQDDKLARGAGAAIATKGAAKVAAGAALTTGLLTILTSGGETKDVGKGAILNTIKIQEMAVAKLEKALDKKMNSSK